MTFCSHSQAYEFLEKHIIFFLLLLLLFLVFALIPLLYYNSQFQLAGEQKKINVYEKNQYSTSNEYLDNLVPENHISISQQNGTNMIQLQTNECKLI